MITIETSDGRKIGRIESYFKGVNGIREAQVIQRFKGAATILVVRSEAEAFMKTY